MNGYYILAIVFIAVAAGLVVTYHSIKFALEMLAEKRIWGNGKAAVTSRLCNFTERCCLFVSGIIMSLILFCFLLSVGIMFDEKAEKELVKYQTRYSTVMTLTDDDFYKYCGDQIAKETVDLAEWIKTTNWSIERYGRFSPYWSLKGRVHLSIGD